MMMRPTPLAELADAIDQGNVRAATFNGYRSVLVHERARPWPRLRPARPPAEPARHPAEPAGDPRPVGRPGARMIATAIGLLFVLAGALFAVSYAAQYTYVDGQRHQQWSSLAEAGALDVGMMICALLALGLARGGQNAKTARALVVTFAIGSALMNFAAADVTSMRSVLAFVMPPLVLAIVVDLVVVSVRRHFLGMSESRSPLGAVFRAIGIALLWTLRFFLDCKATRRGLRQMVLDATPLPAPAAATALPATRTAITQTTRPASPRAGSTTQPGSKTSRFIGLVEETHGPLAGIPLPRVYAIAVELAPQVHLDPGSARTALRARILATQGHQS